MIQNTELAVCCLLLLLCAVAGAGQVGVVVERVQVGGAADRAGVEVGDMLHAWECAPGEGEAIRGELESPFELTMVEIERAPLCSVVLSGARNDEKRSFGIPAGEWRVEVRPVLAEETLSKYDEIREALDGGENGQSESIFVEVAAEARARGDVDLAMWLLHRCSLVLAKADRLEEAGQRRDEAQSLAVDIGESSLLHLLLLDGLELADAERYPQAKEVLDQACELAAKEAPDTLLQAFALAMRGGAERRLGQLDEAERDHTKALAIREEKAPNTMVVAESLNGLANVAFVRGDLETAGRFYERSSELRTAIGPKSIEAAESWSNLGNLNLTMGDVDGAEAAYRRSLAIYEEIAPGTELVGGGLSNLGMVADQRGDLQKAEQLYGEALVLYEKYAPGSHHHGSVLMNLGVVAGERGDLESAEALFKANLEILERNAPDSYDVAGVLNNLGLVAMERGNLEESEAFYRRALAINYAIGPTSPDVASNYENLGFVKLLQGDLDEAETMLGQALAINRELAPGSLWEAGSYTNLGNVSQLRGEVEAARASYRKAREILLELAPESIQMAAVLWDLAEVELERGDLETAERLHQQALSLRKRLAPGSVEEADSLNALGVVHRLMGEEDAASLLGGAVDLLEVQDGRVGGSVEERASFRARRHGYYWDLLDLLVKRGELERAYHVLERSRAQVLLAMMATRDLDFAADVPADLDQDRRSADAAFKRLQEELVFVPADDQEYYEWISAELRRVRGERDRIRDRIRRTAPRFAALSDPQPLDGLSALQVIDEGSVILAFAVGEENCHLFLLAHGKPIRVETFEVGRERLEEMVRLFRGLVENPGTGDSGLAFRAASSALYSVLIAPIEGVLAECERIVIVPDGPLHVLPFAALGAEERGTWRYLVERYPLSVVTSLTLTGQLRSRRGEDEVAVVTVFADPVYESAHDSVPAARRNAGNLSALPATRVEAAAIAELYGNGTQLWLGADATELRAREVDKSTDILHFATHVEIDELRPLESGVFLSRAGEEGRDDGVLRAWEVFESVRIDADLVALSGCQTALGKEIAGEGLVGLTRAFHYAGARTVLASLWRVEDETTAELMRRFYTYLRGGASTDEALRRAQIDLIRAPIVVPDADGGMLDNLGRWVKGLLGGVDGRKVDASHPFYWAAFRLEGDWK